MGEILKVSGRNSPADLSTGAKTWDRGKASQYYPLTYNYCPTSATPPLEQTKYHREEKTQSVIICPEMIFKRGPPTPFQCSGELETSFDRFVLQN